MYDELIRASAIDCFQHNVALCQQSFRHNGVDTSVENLTVVKNSQSDPQWYSTFDIAVESFYSMDGGQRSEIFAGAI